MSARWRYLAIWFMSWVSGATVLEAQQITYSGALSYSVGSYIFDTRSEAFYLSNSLRAGGDRFDATLSIPLVYQNGGVVTTVAEGLRLPTGGTESGVVASRRGSGAIGTRGRGSGLGTPTVGDSIVTFAEEFSTHLGDPTIGASGELYRGFGALRSVRLSGMAKVPVTDLESGVGSGEWDFAMGASLAAAAGPLLLFADASYWWLGDLPDLELANGISYGLGVSHSMFSGAGSVLVMVSGMSRAITSTDPPVSASVSLSHTVKARGFVSGGVGVGLTESASSFSTHIGWSIRR